MEINVDVIKELIASLGASSFDTLKLETEEFKLSIGRTPVAAEAAAPAVSVGGVSAVTAVAAAANVPQVQAEPVCRGTVVKSPIVGTFYASASPDKPQFVTVGQKVKCGDTLFIVESMKLMNEIACECEGTVAEILVQNGQALEFGQPVMRIE